MMLLGAFFALTAAIGVLRLPELYTRMHAASKAGVVGSGLLLLALALFQHDLSTVTRAVAAIVFLLLTAPISAHLLAKAAYGTGYRLWSGSVLDEMGKERTRKGDGQAGSSR